MEAINTKSFRKIADRIRYIIQQLRESGASIGEKSSEVFDMIDDLAKEALITPPRNCDMGTAEEQAERFAKHCSKFPKCMKCPCCGKIRYNNCEFAWAQMPYESEKPNAHHKD